MDESEPSCYGLYDSWTIPSMNVKETTSIATLGNFLMILVVIFRISIFDHFPFFAITLYYL